MNKYADPFKLPYMSDDGFFMYLPRSFFDYSYSISLTNPAGSYRQVEFKNVTKEILDYIKETDPDFYNVIVLKIAELML
jgi:hypothetical protein